MTFFWNILFNKVHNNKKKHVFFSIPDHLCAWFLIPGHLLWPLKSHQRRKWDFRFFSIFDFFRPRPPKNRKSKKNRKSEKNAFSGSKIDFFWNLFWYATRHSKKLSWAVVMILELHFSWNETISKFSSVKIGILVKKLNFWVIFEIFLRDNVS